MGSLPQLQVCWALLVAALAQPQPSPSLSPHSHTGNFVKELFPDPPASLPPWELFGWAQSEAAGARGEGAVLAAKFISESRQRRLLLLGMLGIQNCHFPPPSLGTGSC